MTNRQFKNKISVLENSETRRNIFRICLIAFAAVAVLYVLMVGKTILNIIERKSAESETHLIASRLGELELQYLSGVNKIDLEFAKSSGFIEPRELGFASRKSLSISIARNGL